MTTDLSWKIAVTAWSDERVLLVLHTSTVDYWMRRVPVLECATWGELRATVGPDVYQEVCDLAGYGTFEGFTTHLSITGTVPLPDVHEQAAASYNPEAAPPQDDDPFDWHDLPAAADGDWPAAVSYLMSEELPADVIKRYAQTTETMFNGTEVEIAAHNKEAVVHDLQALGYTLHEDERLATLLNCTF